MTRSKAKAAAREYLVGVDAQPVSAVQWVDRDTLRANDYNPNHMFAVERELLITSITEDGWTQPIVARADGEIVDGFHRWLVSDDPRVRAMTGGLVPVVILKHTEPAQQRMATIRHNRARGSHGVIPMAGIIAELVAMGLDAKAIGQRLGMEGEEVKRLLDRGNMKQRAGGGEFGQGWKPTTKEQQ